MATPTSKTYNEGARCNLLDSILRLVILEMICMRICVAILGGQTRLEPNRLNTSKLLFLHQFLRQVNCTMCFEGGVSPSMKQRTIRPPPIWVACQFLGGWHAHRLYRLYCNYSPSPMWKPRPQPPAQQAGGSSDTLYKHKYSPAGAHCRPVCGSGWPCLATAHTLRGALGFPHFEQ